MKEYDIYAVIMPYIRENIGSYGVSDLNVWQAYQPIIQGNIGIPSVAMFNVNYRRHGWAREEYIWDDDKKEMVEATLQKMESLIQVNVTAPRVINGEPLITTASDIAMSVSLLMQSNGFIQHLRKHNASMLRITDIRNMKFSDEKAQHNSIVSFDVTIIHDQYNSISTPYADSIDYEIYRV